jgi:hypothetical protein
MLIPETRFDYSNLQEYFLDVINGFSLLPFRAKSVSAGSRARKSQGLELYSLWTNNNSLAR